MATLNVGIKISDIRIITRSAIGGTSATDYIIPSGEYAEAEVLGATTFAPANNTYLWIGASNTAGRARAFGTPNSIGVLEIGNISSNTIIPSPQLAGATKVFLSPTHAIGYLATATSFIYEVSLRSFKNTI